MTYDQLKLRYNLEFIEYQDLLNTEEWDEKRKQILQRDNYRCTVCEHLETGMKEWSFSVKEQLKHTEELDMLWRLEYGHTANPDDYETVPDYENQIQVNVAKPYILQIHHLYYVKGKLPWEYDANAFITVCQWCHGDIHRTTKIPYYHLENGHNHLKQTNPCTRCSGRGFLPQFHYYHNGTCFSCAGTGFRELLIDIKQMIGRK